MRRKNKFGRLFLLILSAVVLILALYFVPTDWGGFSMRRIDLLSALRIQQADSTLIISEEEPIPIAKEVSPIDSIQQKREEADSIRQALSQINAAATDSLTETKEVYFEDFNPDRKGLAHSFSKLIHHSGPLYMAFLGDSFIEADIFTLDVRRLLQHHFSGTGVGWMPLSSGVAGYRRGITHRFSGWKELSPLTHHRSDYLLNQHIYQGTNPWVEYCLPDESAPFHKISIYYKSEAEIPFTAQVGDSVLYETLTPSALPQCHTIHYTGRRVKLQFTDADAATFYGVCIDGAVQGVMVDNFSLRSSSGTNLLGINDQSAEALNRLRPYGLIVLQYGMNVVSKGVYKYTSYEEKLVRVIQKLQKDYPHADILIMGVSDRARKGEGGMGTMPELIALRKAQRNAAQRCGVLFWDTFTAMGGTNSILNWAAKGWAAKDYTHISFRGGRFLAEQFVKSFLFEEEYYRQLGI